MATVQTAQVSPVTSCSFPCPMWRLTHEATQFWPQTQVQNHRGHCSTRDALGTAAEEGQEETASGSRKNMSFQTKLGRNSPAAVVLHWGHRDLGTSADPQCPEGEERVLPGWRVEARSAAEHPTGTGQPCPQRRATWLHSAEAENLRPTCSPLRRGRSDQPPQIHAASPRHPRTENSHGVSQENKAAVV